MMRRLAAFGMALVCLIVVGLDPAACGGNSSTTSGADGGGATDASLTPSVYGGDGGSCLKLGGACTSSGECCSGDCTGGVCNYPACSGDGLACASNGNCCSQSCVGGTCAALNTTCKTLGDPCASSGDCCSGRCASGTCQASSFCVQPGDSCSTGTDCCTGACTKAAGQTLGTCATSAPSGPANCGLADGQLCAGNAGDGGAVFIDGGLPQCGGACCSRACAPWGPTGVLVCQPASGCHPVGDLCTKDGDCCGSTGLPGGSGKPVTCVITAPSAVGICRNPMGCKPDGDVCKLKTMSCNSSCDCCAGNCETQDTCHQDNVGVPRCAPGQCVNAGAACASSASCCNNMPCVPNPGGTPPFVCTGTTCVAQCGSCSNNADCCPGTSCLIGTGSARGVCGPCGGGYDGGTPPPYDAATPPPGCALYGQVCTTAANCCNGVPCTFGRCQFPLQ